MRYKYRKAILGDLKRLDKNIYFTDEDGVCDAEKKIKEIERVYRNAQAWDEVAEMIPDLKNWEINDLDFSQTVEIIYERLERDSQ